MVEGVCHRWEERKETTALKWGAFCGRVGGVQDDVVVVETRPDQVILYRRVGRHKEGDRRYIGPNHEDVAWHVK